ncbi:MAG TPA: class I SAM-dependent methyltransferase [candidate division Zixibacteria bacterium]|nr:class I SAM-dependent methyltransferase [candidate division Zixibacteria bacterium]
MESEVTQKLLNINRLFYDQFAYEFAETRYHPQPGFAQLSTFLPRPCQSLLDVGCGNGRLGRFLAGEGVIQKYTGIDSSSTLLEIARNSVEGEFWLRELSDPGCLAGLGHYDAVCCLAVFQHVPGKSNRERLLREFVDHLDPGGVIILSTWQFPGSERQFKKVVDWSNASLHIEDVEPNDYLMTWGTTADALRYVSHIDSDAVISLADSAGLVVVTQYRSDGREGDLNLYSVLSR